MELGNSNREYKDRLFKFIFGNPENRAWILSLYNAVNGSDYKNANDIRFNTIENAVYMNMKNDVSFLIDNTMSLFEHQSTYNPNMPFRFLLYLAKLYEVYSQRDDFYMHSSTLQKIPRPKCICFYNGLPNMQDVVTLRLSDMYFKKSKSRAKKIDEDEEVDVEVKVLMININYGHNKELLNSCRPLYEYSFFVDRVRFHLDKVKEDAESYTLENAVDNAFDDLPKDFVILQFLLKNKAEVKGMCLFEYNQEKHMKALKEEGIKEGVEKGREEGIREGVEKGVKKGRKEGKEEERIRLLIKWVNLGKFTIKEAADEAGISEIEFRKILDSKSEKNKQD